MNTKVKDELLTFLTQHPRPSDEVVHEWAIRHKLKPDKAEEIIYGFLADILNAGKSKGKPAKVDPKQLKMGMKVEMEHTNSKFMARKIATDHLVEISDYYTRLKTMEDAAVKKSHVQSFVRTRQGHLERVKDFFRTSKDYEVSEKGIYSFIEDTIGRDVYNKIISEENRIPGNTGVAAATNAFLKVSDTIGVPTLSETLKAMGKPKYSAFLGKLYDHVLDDMNYIRVVRKSDVIKSRTLGAKDKKPRMRLNAHEMGVVERYMKWHKRNKNTVYKPYTGPKRAPDTDPSKKYVERDVMRPESGELGPGSPDIEWRKEAGKWASYQRHNYRRD